MGKDEARRAMYALDRIRGNPVGVDFTPRNDSVLITPSSFLPCAEYLLLRAVSRRIVLEPQRSYEVNDRDAPMLARILVERLGLRIERDGKIQSIGCEA